MEEQDYPMPQVEVASAREITPAPAIETAPPAPGQGVTDLDYREAGDGSPGLAGKAWDAARWLGREALMPALEKLIPQGADEIAHGIFSGLAYAPVGHQMPVGTEGHGIHGAPAAEPGPEAQSEANGFQVFGPAPEQADARPADPSFDELVERASHAVPGHSIEHHGHDR